MAVFWLVSDRVKVKAEWAQSLLLLLASGPRFNVYARRYRRAKWFFESLLGCLSTGALTKDSRSPPQTTQEASHTSLRCTRPFETKNREPRQTQPKPPPLCTACAHNWAASEPHRSTKYALRRPAVAPTATQQSAAPKAPPTKLPDHRTR